MLLSPVNELHEMPCQCCLLLPFALAAAISPYYPLCYWLIVAYGFLPSHLLHLLSPLAVLLCGCATVAAGQLLPF